MIKTKSLDLICEEFEKYEFNWERVISRYKKVKYDLCNKTPPLPQLCGLFGEIHLDLFLEDMVKSYPELKIILDPVEETYIGDFDFRYVLGRLRCQKYTSVRSESWQQEYDRVATIDSVPVVFEMKLAQWDASKLKKNKKGEKISSTDSIRNQLRPEVYTKKLFPLTQYFNSDVGYVMIIPEQHHYEKYKSPIYIDFLEKNGYLVLFRNIEPSFKEAVSEKLKEHSVEVRAG